MNLPKTELTNEEIDEILELLHNDWLEDDYDPTDCGAMEAKRDLASLIHQAEIKAQIELLHSINENWFLESKSWVTYFNDRIYDLTKQLEEVSNE